MIEITSETILFMNFYGDTITDYITERIDEGLRKEDLKSAVREEIDHITDRLFYGNYEERFVGNLVETAVDNIDIEYCVEQLCAELEDCFKK